MTRVDLDELERKAREAHAVVDGDWRVHFCSDQAEHEACGICTGCDAEGRCDDYASIVGDMSHDECHHPMRLVDAEHIAANSPEVTLVLVARIRELESELGGAIDTIDTCLEAMRPGERSEETMQQGHRRATLAKGVVL